MDSNTQKEAAMPKLCVSGCGFFSNPELNGMCSKCNRELQASQATATAIASTAAPAIVSAQSIIAPAQQSQPQPQSPPSQPAPMPAISQPQSPTLPAIKAPSPPPAAPESQQLSPKVLEAVAVAAAAAAAGQQQQAAAAEDAADDEPPRRVQKHTNRCFSCNKKVGLTGFKCRCGFVFCGPHRLAEAHDCDYDYRGAGRESLAKANPLVTADRVIRF